jgi:hypothetical protein
LLVETRLRCALNASTLVWIRRDIAFLLEDVVYPPPTSCGRICAPELGVAYL